MSDPASSSGKQSIDSTELIKQMAAHVTETESASDGSIGSGERLKKMAAAVSETQTISDVFDEICSFCLRTPNMNSEQFSFDSKKWLVLTPLHCDLGPPIVTTPTRSKKLTLCSDGKATFEVLGHSKTQIELTVDIWEDTVKGLLAFLDERYSCCTGINSDCLTVHNLTNESVVGGASFEERPVSCLRSDKCRLLYQQASTGRPRKAQRCTPCGLVLKRLNSRPAQKKTSRMCNHRYMMLRQRKAIVRALNRKVKRAKEQLRTIKENTTAREDILDTNFSEQQSNELSEITAAIDDNFAPDLDKVLNETAGECSTDFAEQCRSAWIRDQERNRKGSTGNRWSLITYRLALAVFARSPAAYAVLQKFPMMQLPSIPQLKRIISSNYAAHQGSDLAHLAHESQKYDEAQQTKPLPGRKSGILIFDECKLVAKMWWSSRTEEIYGLASTVEDLSSLVDVYRTLPGSGSPQAEFVLQFVWRDLTGNYDVIGPHWFSARTTETQLLIGLVYETLRLFNSVGFMIEAVVSDGASTNMRLMRALTSDCVGKFGVGHWNQNPADRWSVPYSFQNPFQPEFRVFVIPCTTHALKNFVNALHCSVSGGPKMFRLSASHEPFGWQTIVDMWEREKERRKTRSQLVPRLQQSYIVRDSWTKLNVHPAKIMQQEQVLSELANYAQTNPPERQVVEDTLSYLRCCNALFENGFLSHTPIRNPKDGQPLESLHSGIEFVKAWYRSLERCPDFKPFHPRENRFLAYQTFDLIRMSYYGFIGLCSQFFRKHPPGYYIVPVRVSGSAVETVFSQVKERIGGKGVTSVNWRHGLTKLQVSADCEFGNREAKSDDYRSEPLKLSLKGIKK